MFRLHENVRVGTKEQVTTWHRDWISRGQEFLASIGLPAEAVVASDPFFGRGGKMLSATQVEREAKVELVFPIVGERPTAVLSVNYHETHFGGEYDIRTPVGDLAHSACVGFGLDRIVLALFAEFGFDVPGWPEPVRRSLRLPDTAVPA
jgi:seryl-tRNA synthetase